MAAEARRRALERALTAAALALLLLLALAAQASAQAPAGLTATAKERGYIGFEVTAPGAGPVQIAELVGSRARALTTVPVAPNAPTVLPRAATWRCDRRRRRFIATPAAVGAVPSAVVELTTPSCAKRFRTIVKPRRPRAGRSLSITLVDRFGVGDITTRACVKRRGGRARCSALALARGKARRAFRLRPLLPGRWSFRVSARGLPPVERSVLVRRRSGGLRILATGDSMIQIIDSFLKQRLDRGAVSVRSDARISTGISKPALLNWPNLARRQAGGLRPSATVVFLGANDGFPIGGAACCGRAWTAGYAGRVRGMMRTYSRRGAGAVYWLLLPVPRRGNFKPVYRAVNAAVRSAARAYPDTVRVVDLEALFTPGRRYTSSIKVRGRYQVVRQADGVHLNTLGASIAASTIIRALRRDGFL